MNQFHHSMCNDVLGAPAGVPIEECRPLYIMRDVGDGKTFGVKGAPYVISFWKPEPEELELLKQGRPVMLCIQGRTHPPLMVTVATKD